MRKVISILLLVTTLVANISWAADSHAETNLGHDSEVSHDGLQHTDEHGNNEACDHCCHGLSHLTGLTLHTYPLIMLSGNTNAMLPTHHYRTQNYSPPTPPPNA
jgi:hypothetical protein